MPGAAGVRKCGLVEYYSQDHAHIARVLDICLELQV